MVERINLISISKRSWSFILFLIFSSLCLAQEIQVEKLLSQADVLYIQGNYVQASAFYFEVTKITDKGAYLSRAFLGLALCSFHLGEEKETRDYLHKLFSVYSQKELSAHFYPQAFLKIFEEVKQEFLSGEKRKLPAEAGLIDMSGKETESKENQSKADQLKEIIEKNRRFRIEEPELNLVKSSYILGGHLEIELHYGHWSLQPLLSLFERNLKKRIGSEIRARITDYLSSRYGFLVESGYKQELTLEVKGSNEGFGLRYFSRGASGTLSVGFSLERTHFRFKGAGSIVQNYGQGTAAEVEAEAFLKADPVCGHISFRWDFYSLRKLTPYFIFGLGFGPLNGRMGYSYQGLYKFNGYQEAIRDSQDKTFKEWQEEEASHINLDKIILLQACFGLRLDFFRGLSFLLEAGIWDGFLVRGGLAFRL